MRLLALLGVDLPVFAATRPSPRHRSIGLFGVDVIVDIIVLRQTFVVCDAWQMIDLSLPVMMR